MPKFQRVACPEKPLKPRKFYRKDPLPKKPQHKNKTIFLNSPPKKDKGEVYYVFVCMVDPVGFCEKSIQIRHRSLPLPDLMQKFVQMFCHGYLVRCGVENPFVVSPQSI